jgi:triosephosphate isomerase
MLFGHPPGYGRFIRNLMERYPFIRQWICREYETDTAETARIIYGGSVAPEYAEGLLALPEVDGLGASRKGRIPADFAKIVRLIALAQ